MATSTTNYGLTKPSYGDAADIMDINGNMDTIDDSLDAKDRSFALVNTGDTAEANIANKSYVYVRGHSELAAGLYKAVEAIAAEESLTSSNLEAVSLADHVRNIEDSLIVVESKTLFSNFSVNHNEYKAYSGTNTSLLKTGYTLRGVLGYNINGSESTWMILTRLEVSTAGKVDAKLRSTSSNSTTNISVTADLLYVKNL